MPELPEVQTVVDELKAGGMVGTRFQSVQVRWPRTVILPAPEDFKRLLRERVVTAIERRGKFIVIRLDSGTLLIHLRMSGRLRLESAHAPETPYTRVAFRLDDGRRLLFDDPRKFGRIALTTEPENILERLGPEPLDPSFQAQDLAARIRPRRRKLKQLLLDQAVIAGLGNIYVDESLFEAGLHPCSRGDQLSDTEIEALHRAMRLVLTRAIENRGTTLGKGITNFYSVSGNRGNNAEGLKVFRRHGLPCHRCGSLLQRFALGGRGTHICPSCQRQR